MSIESNRWRKGILTMLPNIAIVVGRAAGVLQEYAEATALCGKFDHIIVVGKIGEAFPDKIDYWATFHTLLLDRWAAVRALRGLPPAAHYWGATGRGLQRGEGAKCRPITFLRNCGGSSGLMAVVGALEVLRVDRVVLAGMPMTKEGSHAVEAADPREVGRPWQEADAYWAAWVEHAVLLRGRVRSMSGRTREFLGYPDKEFLEPST